MKLVTPDTRVCVFGWSHESLVWMHYALILRRWLFLEGQYDNNLDTCGAVLGRATRGRRWERGLQRKVGMDRAGVEEGCYRMGAIVEAGNVMGPCLGRIIVYPIKSLDGVSVPQAMIAPGGALVGDREFAIADAQGRWINGKRFPKIMMLRARFDLRQRRVWLQGKAPESCVDFHLDTDRALLSAWLSDFVGQPVQVVQNVETGFPDDLDSPGPTVVSEASLQTVADWYPALNLDSIRRRFRTNLEISNTAAFWEDHLFGEADQPVPFRVGPVNCLGINPCQRCPVPTRDPDTGQADVGFQRQFIAQRQATLPPEVVRSQFNHFYRFTVNTQILQSETGKKIQVGDLITLPSTPSKDGTPD